MTLAPGARLGPYRIEASLGAGGMGEVYRARDPRLDRTVAIKVLPADLAADSKRRQRLEREARAISSLNHPHICTLHDVGEQDGTLFLVMEHLEGETLSDRLAKAPMSVDQALRFAVELTSALGRAHRSGIVHRDLKPGNVMLTPSGVKLLDFGLAKRKPSVPTALEDPDAATRTRPLTRSGAVLGTFRYMAPEQLEGKEVDPRTDLFAFGVVLFEALTGRRAFQGTSQAQLIADILRADPVPVSSLRPQVPPALDRLVRKCLAKDPDDRWQTARDLEDELRWISETRGLSPDAPRARVRLAGLTGWIVAALVAIAVTAIAFLGRSPHSIRVVRSLIAAPEGGRLLSSSGDEGGLALSPDGNALAFVVRVPGAPDRLWLRSLDSLTARSLPGTDGAHNPFWSPDGTALGFFAGGHLKRVAVGGGEPVTVCRAASARGGSWSPDDVILFAPEYTRSPILRVAATGGDPSLATRLDPAHPGETHRWPWFLPDGRRFLYVVIRSLSGSASALESEIRVGSLGGGDGATLLRAASNAAYASDHLLFVRNTALTAQRFDARTLELSGEAFPVAEPVPSEAGRGAFAVSQSGLLVYEEGRPSGGRLTWLDRDGRSLRRVGEPADYSNLGLSPDGRRVAVRARDATGNYDIWQIDFASGVPSRLTFDKAFDGSAVWSPDGTRIAFDSNRGGQTLNLYVKSSSGAGEEALLLESPQGKTPTDWSKDGRLLVYTRRPAATNLDVCLLALAGGIPSCPLQTEASETHGQLSPDAKLLAYASDASGAYEVSVVSLPGAGGRWQVSSGGGMHPRWRADGRELFFIGPGGRLMAAQLGSDGQALRVEALRPLFDLAWRFDANNRPYDVSADGRRFIVVAPAEGTRPSLLTLLQGWDAALGR
jgi:Tol biopolymer transport system component